MLEMARLIYTGNDGAAAHASKLADCYMYIGDILAEQEKFEEAVKEYNTALEMLEKVRQVKEISNGHTVSLVTPMRTVFFSIY